MVGAAFSVPVSRQYSVSSSRVLNHHVRSFPNVQTAKLASLVCFITRHAAQKLSNADLQLAKINLQTLPEIVILIACIECILP
jgi:hypothetical protein